MQQRPMGGQHTSAAYLGGQHTWGERDRVLKNTVCVGISTPPELAMRGGTPRGALDIYRPPPPLEAWGGAVQNKQGAYSMQVRVGGWVGSRLELSLTCSSSR